MRFKSDDKKAKRSSAGDDPLNDLKAAIGYYGNDEIFDPSELLPFDPDRKYELYSDKDLDALKDRIDRMKGDAKDRLKNHVAALGEENQKKIAVEAITPEVIGQLYQAYPNFSEVLDDVRRFLALCYLDKNRKLDLPPMLLAGGAGLGKTSFVNALAKVLDTVFFEFQMASMAAGFSLSGLDLGYSTGKPGAIFGYLVDSNVINPLILLDEIDKAAGDDRYKAHGPLYTLLEPKTAQRYKDEAIPLPLDASHVIWMATANDLSSIPEPILDRFRIYEIKKPTRQQGIKIARSVYQTLLESNPWGHFFSKRLPEEVAGKMATLSGREMRKTLLDALAKAATRKSKILRTDDISVPEIQEPRSIGFHL